MPQSPALYTCSDEALCTWLLCELFKNRELAELEGLAPGSRVIPGNSQRPGQETRVLTVSTGKRALSSSRIDSQVIHGSSTLALLHRWQAWHLPGSTQVTCWPPETRSEV